MGNTLLVSASPRTHLAQCSVSHGNRRCWFGWSMSPSLSLLPFPSDASSNPSSCVRPSRKQCSPIRFSCSHHDFASLRHPLQPEQPQHFQSLLGGLRSLCCFGCPSWSPALPPLPSSRYQYTSPRFILTPNQQCGAGSFLFSWATTQLKILQMIGAVRRYRYKFRQPHAPQ